ncbi:metallopeptidase TldD-related protein [Butyrivibrio sp. MC2013]|uniref:metallopeptidase TldD-related protein n=1 Tax=Butyrivibrio sp. MC2013 TaxID=1280686 RepID=UPI00041BCD66|nr:metallopeptidase TldD-related protein [Butyrivibrio sp. MC2013]
MYIDEIIDIIKECGADAWIVEEKAEKNSEFYFIRHRLDQDRLTDVVSYRVTVFKNSPDKITTGKAEAVINPGENKEYLKKIISELMDRALDVKDKYYSLKPAAKDYDIDNGSVALDAGDISAAFVRTMESVNESPTADINSYEVFGGTRKTRIVTSSGVDLTYEYPSSMMEAVINARNEEHEIELYRSYYLGSCASSDIKASIEEALSCAADRLIAEPTPDMHKIDCVFSTKDACEIYRYFLDNLNAANIYMKLCRWKKDAYICEGITGDKLNITARRFLENSSTNWPCDCEGSLIKDTDLMKDMKPVAFWGGTKYSSYLGEKDAFMVTNSEFTGGSCSEEEIRRDNYLEVMEFSDFQVDSMTGDIFGEIRLAYLYENGKRRILTGGSVSGSMLSFMKTMKMSKDSMQYNNMLIPKLTRLKDVTINGAG